MFNAGSDINNLSTKNLGNSLTQLAAHINTTTCQFLLLIAEFDRMNGNTQLP